VQIWPVQEAKARFSEFLNSCLNEGPQIVTKRGQQTAILIPISEWERLNQTAKPDLKTLLLMNLEVHDLDLPKREHLKLRKNISL
jgi:prevent-host-death family protein